MIILLAILMTLAIIIIRQESLAEPGVAGPGVVYVGRIPHGFYEKEMREYFSQFGKINKLKLSRNKKVC